MGVGVVWGGWIGVGVVGGLPATHVHMHAHTHAHTHVVNMIISCKWLWVVGWVNGSMGGVRSND